MGRAPGRRRGAHRLRARRHQPRRHLVQRASLCSRCADRENEGTSAVSTGTRPCVTNSARRAGKISVPPSAVVASPSLSSEVRRVTRARFRRARAGAMTTAIAMDVARPPAAAARLRSGRFRASSRRASRFATPRASRIPIFLGRPAGRAPSRGHRRRRHRRPRRLRRASSRWRRRARLRARHRAPLERGHGHRALAERAQGAPVRRPGRGARGGVARPRHLRHAHGRRGRDPTPKPARVSPPSRPNSATPPSPRRRRVPRVMRAPGGD